MEAIHERLGDPGALIQLIQQLSLQSNDDLDEILLVAYLRAGKHSHARFLIKRKLNPSALFASYAQVAKSLWFKDWPGAFQSLNSIEPPTDLFSAHHQLLVRAMRDHVLALISKAYESIPLSKVASMIGLSLDESKCLVESIGWTVTDLVYPIQVSIPTTRPNLEFFTKFALYSSALEI